MSDEETFELPASENGESPIKPVASLPDTESVQAPPKEAPPVAPADAAEVPVEPAAPVKKRRKATEAQLEALARGRKIYQAKRRRIRDEKALEKAEKIKARNNAIKAQETQEYEKVKEDLDTYKLFLTHMSRYEKYKASKAQAAPAPTVAAPPPPAPARAAAPIVEQNPYASFFA